MADRSVVIVDAGVGNHQSVQNALALLGVSSVVSSDPGVLAAASHLILPGVGSFEEGMKGIHARSLVSVLREEVMDKKKPILGICLGMQLFTTEGFENGQFEGLGFVPGTVIKIDIGTTGLRLPHIGWNNVALRGDHPVTKGFGAEPIFYFVHSYHLVPDDPADCAGTCDYGQSFLALLGRGNIYGAQFHPEKSHTDGLQVFRNFLNLS
jgi:imidazole glycerol-phosphate synthase subunit HisH